MSYAEYLKSQQQQPATGMTYAEYLQQQRAKDSQMQKYQSAYAADMQPGAEGYVVTASTLPHSMSPSVTGGAGTTTAATGECAPCMMPQMCMPCYIPMCAMPVAC